MELNEEREYYTFSELLLSLKDYFLEGRKILNDMLDLIDISSKSSYKTRIWIEQHTATNFLGEFVKYKKELYEGVVHIDVTKKYSPTQAIRELKVVYDDECKSYYFDNARFTLENVKDDFKFNANTEFDSKLAYKPQLKIKDKDKFNRLYQRLIDEGYLTYPSILYFFPSKDNSECSIVISSVYMGLTETNPMDDSVISFIDRCFLFNYWFEDDSIIFKDTRKNPMLSIDELFNLKIDKRNIYKGYIPIIEKYLSKPENSDLLNTITDLLNTITNSSKSKRNIRKRIKANNK